MANDYMDQQDEGSQDNSDMDMENDNTPEEKMGLVPLSFFNKDVKPGDKETVEVTAIKDGEAVIKCVYGEGKDEGGSDESDTSDSSAPSEAEDSMMT